MQWRFYGGVGKGLEGQCPNPSFAHCFLFALPDFLFCKLALSHLNLKTLLHSTKLMSCRSRMPS